MRNVLPFIKTYIKHPFFLLLAIGLMFRLVLVVAYEIPVFEADSYGYRELASFLFKGKLFDYQGWRTPGYPLILFISMGEYYIMVVLLQFAMSVVSTYFLYDLLSQTMPKVAFIFTLFYFTLVKVMMYEFNILTETSALFLLTLSVWLVYKYDIVNIKASFRVFLLLAFVLTYCFLVRPMFIYIVPILAFFMVFNIRKRLIGSQIVKVAIVVVLPFSAYLGWNTLNYVNTGWCTVTTFSGINLAQTAVTLFHNADDEHGIIREIYQKHINESEKLFEEKRSSMENKNVVSFLNVEKDMNFEYYESNSIWRAYNELIEATGLSGVELSHNLGEISKELIMRHPKEYLVQTGKSWYMFWLHNDVPINNNRIKNKEIISVYSVSLAIQKVLLILLNILLVPSAIVILYSGVKKRNLFSVNNFLIILVVAGSILQAMVTYGGSSRYFYPFIPLVIILVSVGLSNILSLYDSRRHVERIN